MDIGKLLKNVNNLNQYVETTHNSAESCKISKIQLNMSTVLALKKIRSLEIEYFNKCEENGIACVIFERMLCLPGSKTWAVLSKELVILLQYWLDAIRKHLIKHNLHWWTFLKLLLKFIKDIRIKDTCFPNMLVEYTAECLLDLATLDQPDAVQKYEILHCFNVYCSESCREIRFAMRNNFGQYFTKLSVYMSGCGHLPTQYSVVETLVRWLVPRQDRALRLAVTHKWFPTTLYSDETANIFLERQWANFFKDARDLLNSHNSQKGLVASVVCRKLSVGALDVITGQERLEAYLDINLNTRCISVLLDPKVLEAYGTSQHKGFETLVITYDDTETAKLHRQSVHVTLSVHTTGPARAQPSGAVVGGACDVTAVLSSRCHLATLTQALQTVFGDKYEMCLDLNKELTLSPINQVEDAHKTTNATTDEDRFSLPVEVKNRKKSGYIQSSRQHRAYLRSPSTASTTSLLQLHEKLAALPKYRFDKEPVSVCAKPDLSVVSEASETESLNTTLKFKKFGVLTSQRKLNLEETSQSDPEPSRFVRNKSRHRHLSPVVRESGPSLLLAATLGTIEEKELDKTVETLSKNKDFDPETIVDLLLKEALQAEGSNKDQCDNNKDEQNPDDHLENSEAIENTPNTEINLKKRHKNKSKVISSTSDESNTEAISDTPMCYINKRNKNKDTTDKTAEVSKKKDCEDIFSKNVQPEIPISPSLARKMNETSSETSDNFDKELDVIGGDLQENFETSVFNNIEVIECLNDIVDKLCDELDKCTKLIGDDSKNNSDEEDELPIREIINKINENKVKNTSVEETSKQMKTASKTIKLKFKSKTRKQRKTRTEKAKKPEPIFKMSTIIEAEDTIMEKESAENANNDINKENKTKNDNQDIMNKIDSETPKTRRKRKLFSPNNDQIVNEDEICIVAEENVSSELQIKQTPKAIATCYKDIERDRQKRIQMPRNRRTKMSDSSPSPRTKKLNDLFDKVKDFANNGPVTLADKTFGYDVYNMSSDSDEDFKQKKVVNTRKKSTKSVAKRGRVAKREKSMSDDKSAVENKPAKNRKVTRKPRIKKKDLQTDLIDERMREAKEDLNTSIVVEKTTNIIEEPQLELNTAPEMELIQDEVIKEVSDKQKPKKKPKYKTRQQAKQEKQLLEIKYADDDRTESPLPGLVVETVNKTKEDQDLSVNLVEKFKKIYHDAPEKYINESNTTQNLLSDVERINYSQGIDDNIYEAELNETEERPASPSVRKSNTKVKDVVAESKHKGNTEKKENLKQKTNKKLNSKTKNKNIKKDNKESNIVTRNKNNSEIEVTDTSIKADKSFASVEITAHGDFNESPPSLRLMAETFEPRNLDVEYFDESMKKYFEKLSQEIARSHRSYDSNKPSKVVEIDQKSDKSNKTSRSSRSLVVRVSRLNSDDIQRFLPSNRNSSEDSPISNDDNKKENTICSKIDLRSKRKLYTTPKEVSHENSDSDGINQPHTSISQSKHDSNTKNTKSSQESKVSDKNNSKSLKLTYKRTQLSQTSIENIKSNTKHSDFETRNDETPEKLNRSERKLKNNKNCPNPKTSSNNSNNSDEIQIVPAFETQAKSFKVSTPRRSSKRLSNISPIKLFDDLISNADKQTCSLSDDENYMQDIIDSYNKEPNTKLNLRSRSIRLKSPQKEGISKNTHTISSCSKDEPVSSRNTKKVTEQKEVKTKNLLTPSTSSKVDEVRNSKRRIAEEERSRKKMKIASEENASSGAVTVSSVDDWFKRMEPEQMCDKGEEVPDILRHVLEKLDTTLVEIDRRTSNELASLFVGMQQDLKSLESDHYEMYKSTAAEIISQVMKMAVTTMDEKFNELANRKKELDAKFLRAQKARASQVLRADCQQKHTLLRLLKDDVRAVHDHLRTRRDDSP